MTFLHLVRRICTTNISHPHPSIDLPQALTPAVRTATLLPKRLVTSPSPPMICRSPANQRSVRGSALVIQGCLHPQRPLIGQMWCSQPPICKLSRQRMWFTHPLFAVHPPDSLMSHRMEEEQKGSQGQHGCDLTLDRRHLQPHFNQLFVLTKIEKERPK
jgi:hypothetical protein